MRGHFKKRGDRWYFWVELPPGPDGSRRQKSMGGFATRRQAEEAYAALRDRLRTKGYLEPTKLTVAQYLQGVWLPAIEVTVRPSTLDHYRNSAVYVEQAVGTVPLAKRGPRCSTPCTPSCSPQDGATSPGPWRRPRSAMSIRCSTKR